MEGDSFGPLFDALRPEGPDDVVAERRAVANEVLAALATLGQPPTVTERSSPTSAEVELELDLDLGDDPPLVDDLRRLFGFDAFRPGQREVIEAVLAGRDALAVMPTGAGKSLTYSLPALRLPGATLVVSPLIALMEDQVAKLRERDLPVGVIHSQVPYAEQQRALADLEAGRLKLLFVAPERFRSGRFERALGRATVSLLAVDEAHCVSQWGHDFRPDYLRLGDAARACGRPPILAVTATATCQVQQDIVGQLGLDDPEVLVRGFDRPNLFLSASVLQGGVGEKLRQLHAAIRGAAKHGVGDGPGIVYCATRRNTERAAKSLSRAGVGRVAAYHAGLKPEVRARVQERFFAGKLDAVVATNAFGLGIDKADVRYVVHHDLPGSLESYYQEAGRAGRDGQPALCALLFAPQDVHLQRFFITTSHPPRRDVEQVAWAAARVGFDEVLIERKLAGAVKGRAIEAALRLLERADGELDRIDFAAVEARARHEELLLDQIVGYARGRGCLRRTILDYFGADVAPPRCEGCDRCCPPVGREAASASALAPSARATATRKKTTRKKAIRKKTTRKKTTRKRASGGDESGAVPAGDLAPAAADAGALSRLRQLRARLAKRGRVPPYKVFHDRTLMELASRRPATQAELLDIYGIGERKAARYGKQILKALSGG